MAVQNLVLRRLGVFSCAKMSGMIHAAFGLFAGLVLTFFAMIGAAIGVAAEGAPEALLGLLFGVGAVIALPILYGVLGFIGGAIGAVLYNLAAGLLGGIEVEFE